MVNEDDLKVEKIKQQKRFKGLTSDIQKIWESISDNYELIKEHNFHTRFYNPYDTRQSRRIFNLIRNSKNYII